jgi:hypothetical protein
MRRLLVLEMRAKAARDKPVPGRVPRASTHVRVLRACARETAPRAVNAQPKTSRLLPEKQHALHAARQRPLRLGGPGRRLRSGDPGLDPGRLQSRLARAMIAGFAPTAEVFAATFLARYSRGFKVFLDPP